MIEVTFEAVEPTQLFVDLFQLPAPGSDAPPELVAEADPGRFGSNTKFAVMRRT